MRARNVVSGCAGVVAAVAVFLVTGGLTGEDLTRTPDLSADEVYGGPAGTVAGDASLGAGDGNGSDNVNVGDPVAPGRVPLLDLDVPSDAGPDESVDEPGTDDIPATSVLPSGGAEAGADLPEMNPLAVEGAVTTFYMAENPVQAGALGVPADRVRSWGMNLRPTGDPAVDHRRIVEGMDASGITIDADMLEGNDTGFGVVYGTYEGWVLTVIVSNWTSMTVTLVAP